VIVTVSAQTQVRLISRILHQPQSTNGLRLLEDQTMLYMAWDIALETGSEPLEHLQIWLIS